MNQKVLILNLSLFIFDLVFCSSNYQVVNDSESTSENSHNVSDVINDYKKALVKVFIEDLGILSPLIYNFEELEESKSLISKKENLQLKDIFLVLFNKKVEFKYWYDPSLDFICLKHKALEGIKIQDKNVKELIPKVNKLIKFLNKLFLRSKEINSILIYLFDEIKLTRIKDRTLTDNEIVPNQKEENLISKLKKKYKKFEKYKINLNDIIVKLNISVREYLC
ncbi:hypothetical protein H312_01131 [Anncaliia algerae PRA339]|uniref:Uncharacterized protein n=1 Tax=Anncaliia algerae PRA339 TaxID=1288291 RepID=A0A059F383_9MICR|nr:hypothetical protein H312_01131 [Anncaliia algerae PRA339]